MSGDKNIADAPSRLFEGPPEPYVERKGPYEIGSLDGAVTAIGFDEKILALEEVKAAAAQDQLIQAVISYIRSGEWPKSRGGQRETPGLRSFQAAKDELYVGDDLLMKAGAVVVPESLRHKALVIAYRGHPGETATKSILRARVWWPRMDREIEQHVAACMSCTLVAKQSL